MSTVTVATLVLSVISTACLLMLAWPQWRELQRPKREQDELKRKFAFWRRLEADRQRAWRGEG
jgi:hypothetical protein